ncbi:hypothetical protein [Oceanicoccus sp. KOV_DT_Chl]|uniref:hypothetical protein n=1 Tax=Oceanicoccus sp. KOV_DT_Chl TaxID=1904639 RepID=UPI000C7AF049|nr:hypothetical protein [Oceanicoccus sp. KOV_DT_Chl]
MQNKILAILGFLILPLISNAAVTILTDSNGQIYGAEGIEVNNSFYSIRLSEGSCIDIFNGCDQVTDFTFHTFDEAMLASQALVDQLFIGAWDRTDDSLLGCDDEFYCGLLTVYNPYDGHFFSLLALHGVSAIGNGVGDHSAYAAWDTTYEDKYVFVIWSHTQPAMVPVPAAIWLFGSAMIGLVSIKRKN